MFVHPVARFLGFEGMADGVAVLDDVLAGGKVFQGELVSGGDVFVQRDFLSVHDDFLAGGQGGDSYGHIVSRVDFQVFGFHIISN